MTPSRPLVVLGSAIGDVAETFIRRHMVDLLPGGTIVMVATADKPNCGHWDVPCPVLVLDRVHGDYFATVERFLTEHGVQVFLGEYLDQSVLWLDLAKRLGIRFFGHAHGYDVSEPVLHRLRASYLNYARADGLITMSGVSRTRLIEFGLEPAKVHAIPYGVDVPPKPASRLDRDVVRCLAVSRMVAKKGPIIALDAFRRAAETFPRLRLDYIGAGALLPAARQYVHALGLQGRVTLHGVQPNHMVHRMMAEADIFVQHSLLDSETGDVEGLPVTILEAMAHGLPVVATEHAGIPEAVTHGSTGYLVAEGDVASMAERIVALARNAPLRRHLGLAGWQRAKERFSWERERTALLNVLGLSHEPGAGAEAGNPQARERPAASASPLPPPPSKASAPLPEAQCVASISADPNPLRVFDGTGLGVTTLSWSSDRINALEVHVDAPYGPLFCRSGRQGSARTGKWVRNGTVFYLQDVTKGKALSAEHTVASVIVHVVKESG